MKWISWIHLERGLKLVNGSCMRCMGVNGVQTDGQLQCHHLGVRRIVRNEACGVVEVRKGASWYYVSEKIDKSYVAINVATLAKRTRDVASSIVDFIAFAFIHHRCTEKYREHFVHHFRSQVAWNLPLLLFSQQHSSIVVSPFVVIFDVIILV